MLLLNMKYEMNFTEVPIVNLTPGCPLKFLVHMYYSNSCILASYKWEKVHDIITKFEEHYSYGNPFTCNLCLFKIKYVWKIKGNFVSYETIKSKRLVEGSQPGKLKKNIITMVGIIAILFSFN